MERARRDHAGAVGALLAAGSPVAVLGEPGSGVTTTLGGLADGLADGAPVLRTGGLRSLQGDADMLWRRALQSIGSPAPGGADPVSEIERRVGPGVLVVDDLQWVGPVALESLMSIAARHRVLVGIRSGDPGTEVARRAVASAGGTVQRLGPLSDDELLAIASSAAPGRPVDEVRSAVEQSSGNPGVMLRLLVSGSLGPALGGALGSIAATQDEDVRVLLAAIGRADHPLPPQAVGELLGHLVGESLVEEVGLGVRLRHGVVGEAAYDSRDAAARRRVHQLLASTATGAVERARHLFDAGDVDGARTLALDASVEGDIGSRLESLVVASRCVEGADRVELLARAVRLALAEGLRDDADRLADVLAQQGPRAAPELALIAEARAVRGRTDAAGFIDAALAAADGEDRVRASGARTLLLAWPTWDDPGSRRGCSELPAAQSPHDIVGIARAAARLVGGDRRWSEEGARPSAPATALADVLFAVRRRATAVVGAATELAELIVDYHRSGDADAIGPRLGSLVAELDVAVDRELCVAHHAVCLADSGRTGAAGAVVARLLDEAQTPVGRAAAAWAQIETDHAAARLTSVLASGRRGLADVAPFAALARVAIGWSSVDAGQGAETVEDLLAEEAVDAPWLMLSAAPLELEALRLSAAHADGGARSVAFDAAAAAWRGHHLRGELRCEWAAADALVDGATRGDALDRLRSVEQRAAAKGLRQLVARCRSSMRSAGVRATPARGARRGVLSAREVEVLELVRLGFTTKEAARTLGVAPSTVDTQVESAMRKLGANTRLHAALLAASAGQETLR